MQRNSVGSRNQNLSASLAYEPQIPHSSSLSPSLALFNFSAPHMLTPADFNPRSANLHLFPEIFPAQVQFNSDSKTGTPGEKITESQSSTQFLEPLKAAGSMGYCWPAEYMYF